MRWIVIANTVSAKIYARDSKNDKRLMLITELNHPEGLQKDQDLVSDRPGHYQTDHATRGSYEESHAKATQNDRFALSISNLLEKARTLNQFQSITLITAPHFLGLLEKHFTKSTKKLIDKIIEKNLPNITERELEEIITRK